MGPSTRFRGRTVSPPRKPRAKRPARPSLPWARCFALFALTFFALEASASEAADARRALLLDHVRTHLLGSGTWRPDSHGVLRNQAVNDVGKHWWPRIFAELERDPSANARITQRDGSSFVVRELITGLIRNAPDDRAGVEPRNPAIGYLYFSPVGIGYVAARYPSLVSDEDLRVLVRQTLHYDPRFSALNALTGQGTENHMLMGRTGGYLVAQTVVSRGAADPVTGEFDAEARRWLAALKPYFLETARSTFEAGFGEWDSSIYYPYVVACWVAIHDLAADPDVRGAARAVLDWMAATVALRTTAGVFGGAEQRSNAPMRSGQSNLDQLGWLWWGGLPGDTAPAFSGQDYSQLVYLALSSYRPPEVIARLARKELPPEAFGQHHFETKPSYVVHGNAAVRQQSRVLTYLHRDYTLGAAIARPTGGWTGGDNQDLLWKLVARRDDGSALVLHGGRGRDPWRQVGQWRGVLIDVWHTPANAAALREDAMAQVADWRERRGQTLRRVFPADTSRENPVRPREVAVADRRASLVFSDGRAPGLPRDGQPVYQDFGHAFFCIRAVGAGLHPIPPGGYGGYIVETGSMSQYGTFAAFRAAIAQRDRETPPQIHDGQVRLRTLEGETVDFAYATAGTYVEPEYDWGFGDTIPVGGTVIMAMPPFEFPPWPSGEGHGRVPQLAINGAPIETLFTSDPYRGPNVTVSHGVLTVTDGRETHRITWRGETPVD